MNQAEIIKTHTKAVGMLEKCGLKVDADIRIKGDKVYILIRACVD